MKTLLLLLLTLLIGCSSQNSQKELELLQKENELLKREKELSVKEAEKATNPNLKIQRNQNKPLSYSTEITAVDTANGTVQDSPIEREDNSKLAQKLRRILIGHEFKKGKLSWKFIADSEIDELQVTNHYKGQDGIEYAQINVVLNDFYGKGGRYYGKLLITYVGSMVTEIQAIEYYQM